MPSAANGEVEKHAFIPVENSPIRRVVEILQAKIACLEKQRSKLSSGKDVKSVKDGSEQKGGSAKAEEISQMLEFVWDLCKQAMGIAVLSENEAKKQARKESALRKSQDTQLVRDVLMVLDCLEQLNDPTARADFLSGSCGASQLTPADLKALDDLYPEVAPKHCPEEGLPSFEVQTMNAAKHLVAIIDGSPKEVIGTTYAHLKDVVTSVHECGYLDHPRVFRVEEVEEEEIPEVREEGPPEMEYTVPTVPPATSPLPSLAPPPPAPQAVPAPTFPLLPPNPPPVTLQQIEHAYFAQQYGHRQKPPIQEVFGPQSFIFLQESEIDPTEIARPPSPGSISPVPIPSQTFTNQNFAIPAQQHFVPELAANSQPPSGNSPQPNHYQPVIPEVSPPHLAGFPSANPPPPIPMPPSYPSQSSPTQQRLPSPFHHPVQANFQPPPEAPVDVHDPEPEYSAWNESPAEDTQDQDRLEINEWNPAPVDAEPEEGQYTSDKFRPRGRGRSNFRARGGGYQNGGRPGSYYRSGDSYQSRETNGNGGSYNDNYREGRYENSSGGYQQGGYKGSRGGSGARGGRGGEGAAPRGGRGRGTAGRARAHYPRKPAQPDTKQYVH